MLLHGGQFCSHSQPQRVLLFPLYQLSPPQSRSLSTRTNFLVGPFSNHFLPRFYRGQQWVSFIKNKFSGPTIFESFLAPDFSQAISCSTVCLMTLRARRFSCHLVPDLFQVISCLTCSKSSRVRSSAGTRATVTATVSATVTGTADVTATITAIVTVTAAVTATSSKLPLRLPLSLQLPRPFPFRSRPLSPIPFFVLGFTDTAEVAAIPLPIQEQSPIQLPDTATLPPSPSEFGTLDITGDHTR